MKLKQLVTLIGLSTLGLTAACASAAQKDLCSIEVRGTTHSFKNIYAVRAHDPYDGDDTTRLTRLICADTEMADTTLSDQNAMMRHLMETEEHSLFLQIRDNGDIVTVGAKSNSDSGMWNGPFGGFKQITFTGSNDAQSITGTITTDKAFEDKDSNFSVSITATLEHAIDITL